MKTDIEIAQEATMKPITQIAAMMNILQSGAASAERVYGLLDAEEQGPDPVTATTLGTRSKSCQSSTAQLRKNRPMSLSTGTPSAIALAICRFGAG